MTTLRPLTEAELRFWLCRRDLNPNVRKRAEANLAGDYSGGRWMMWRR